MRNYDLTGQRFGRLVPIERAGKRASYIAWLCQCDCGQRKVVASSELRSGRTRSCGCLRRENTGNMFRKHGKRNTPEFGIWANMRERCSNPKNRCFPLYGARGISVCERWQSDFAAFYDDMGPRPSPAHTIDRIDNDGPYSPENCRWADKTVQAFNRRSTVVVAHNGEEMSLCAYAREMGICEKALWYRHRHLGEPLETAVEKIR